MKLTLSKKALLSVLIILLPVIISFFIGYISTKTSIERHIFDDLTVLTDSYEGQVYQFLEMSRRRVEDFSSDGLIKERFKKAANGDKKASEELSEHLNRNKKSLDKAINCINVISLDGRIVASTDASLIGSDVSDRNYYKNALKGRFFSENIFPYNGLNTVSFSSPIKDIDTGRTIGTIVNFISLEDLNGLLSGKLTRDLGALSWDKGKPKTLDVYLVNGDKKMITESRFEKGKVLRQVVDTVPVNDCLLNNKEMSQFYKNYRGEDVAGASMCFPNYKWTLLVEIDNDEVFESVKIMEKSVVIVGVIITLITSLIFLVLSRRVILPIENISLATEEIRQGNYNISIPVQTSDEIGALANAFNIMASEINAWTASLKKSEESLRRAQQIAKLGNWEWDIVKNDLRWSDEIYRIFGVKPHEFEATYEAFLRYVHPDDRELVNRSVNDALSGNSKYDIDHRIVLSDGSEHIVHEHAEVAFDENGTPVRMVGTVQDVTEHKKSEAELKKLSMVIEHSINIIFITDIKGKIEYVNPMFETITGWSREEAIGKNPRILASGETAPADYEELWKIITSGKTWRGSFKNKKKNGQPYWGNAVITPIRNERGDITHFLAVQEDITEKRESEERMQYLEHFDEMTGLINRSRFMELLSEWIYNADVVEDKGILLLIDIDEFKFINDTYGHGVGDELLRRMAILLQEIVNEERASNIEIKRGVLEGRMGGDEFSLFIPGLEREDGRLLAEKIRNRFGNFRLMEGLVHATVSVGAVLFPEHGITTKDLFTRVDAAVYRAKEMGRNRCHIYSPEDRILENIHLRLQEKEKIQKALKEDRFEPWFQPILDLSDDSVHHYEILARMRDEDGAILLPRVFIDTAERFGLIGAIDRTIAEKTMKMQAELSRKGKKISFGMNISGKNLGDEDLLAFLQSKILETGADPNYLMFEITETAAVQDLERAIRFISALKALGCKFLLDDFGVGFTSFVYLKEMRVDYIKIDGSFIRMLHENRNDQLFVKAITDVARGMGIKTVAEFVEVKETINLLKEFGVDYAQGYAIGKPSPELLSR